MSRRADADAPLVRLVRDEGRSVLASLVRALGDLGRAEDAVQDAVVEALRRWPVDGVPPNPRAWLLLTARRRAVDSIRREVRRPEKETEAVRMMEQRQPDPDEGGVASVSKSMVDDDLLRLVFTCCHPSLAPETQVALSLRTLCGLSVAEVSRALIVSEAAMARRLVRARQKIALAAIPYRVPSDHELPDRVAAVATTTYLLFNEGYAATAGDDHLRTELVSEAIGLGRLLVDLLPGDASLQGLLALMVLQHARTPSRVDDEGQLVLLADQDRTRWDRDAIAEGVVLVGEGLRRTPDRPDRYVVQAAIAACHALAPTWADTDWAAIVSWYDVLVGVDPSPVVGLNRAAAVAERDGPAPALALVDALDGLGGYALWHATRAELLTRLARPQDAAAAVHRALAQPVTGAQRRLLASRLAALGSEPTA